MKKRDQRQRRLQMVLREYQTALIAVGILDTQLRRNPSALADYELRPKDFLNFQSNLEATYLLRLFAEFESALRSIWAGIGKTTQPKTSDLLDGLAARRTVPTSVLHEAHDVRVYRNSLVHEDATDAAPVAFGNSIRTLLRFLGYMPPDW
ncbi:MAG: hypothetical protein JWM97_1629 [Phycisphaerales bacterium]|nr:hypothetical protein [Phycisphaerales bacterium]